MKQVVQSISGGAVRVVDVPRPSVGTTEVLVRTAASIISPGTERAVTQLAQSSLAAKAKARPDLVRQVINKARTEGIAQTYRQVRTRLDEDMPLGYSGAGIAVEVGELVSNISPGQLVATGGGGKANHAEYQAVPGLLCIPVPEGIAAVDAAFSTIASIALHGLRLAEVGPGSKVVVIGLGLLGQLSIRLARAAGCQVAGIDVDEFPVKRAEQSGAFALLESGEDTTKAIGAWTRGGGADAVIITAGGSSSDAIMRTPALCRDRANIVVVGAVGLHISRTPFYEKELRLLFARSYGPGRYERSYEEWGVDYPPGFVRWTEGRNLEAVLDLMSNGQLRVDDLVTHSFGIQDAASAYRLIEERSEPYLGIRIDYPDGEDERPVRVRRRSVTAEPGVGLIGAGSFARGVLVPAMKEAGFSHFVSVTSASGLSARNLAEHGGFEKAVSGADAVIDDPDVGVVVIATPHESHARYAAQALRAGKHVFCEKPLALTMDELDDVEAAHREGGGVLFIGFNRRFSKPIAMVREHFAGTLDPLVITYRVNAGSVPSSHWYNDRRQGGRLLGEGCHFVDTCIAIAGEAPGHVHAFGSARGELLLSDDFAVSLRFPSGSIATVTYASGGHLSVEKERIEILGGGKAAAVIDFREVVLNGESRKIRPMDKGHRAELDAFNHALRRGEADSSAFFESSRATLEAACELGKVNGRVDQSEDEG